MYILDRKCKVDGIMNEIPIGAIILIMNIRVNSTVFKVCSKTYHLSLFSHTKKEQIKSVRNKFN